MFWVATIGMHRAWRAREKNFSSPEGSFSPVVANACYSSHTNRTGRLLRDASASIRCTRLSTAR